MKRTLFFKTFLFALVLLIFVSCDKDFNDIGSNIIGDDHFLFDKYDLATVVANNNSTGPVQSNNLEINPLGIYNNPAFGKTTANFVTQLELAVPNPTFYTHDLAPQVESVILTIPYYSKVLTSNADGSKTYELDSIYGPASSKIKLGVYRNTFFLKDLDHDADGTQMTQRYYSDQNAEIDNPVHQDADRLNNAASAEENDQFFFSNSEHLETTTNSQGNTVTTHIAPEMKLTLDKNKFQQWILEAPAGSLVNNNVFKNYFRGLYFKVENTGTDEGQLAMLNFKAGKITVNYKQDLATTTTVGGVPTTTYSRIDKSLVLNMTGNSVSLLNNTGENADYTNAINSSATALGAPKLYLKGGQGAVATIDLFGADDPLDSDNIPEELETLKASGWLINEANLTFYIDHDEVGDPLTKEPLRIYLYDVNNKRPLVDYLFDNSASSSPKFSKNIHGGIIIREDPTDENSKGVKYKIRITNYIRDLISKDSTNVRLGLSVTESIGISSMAKLKNPNPTLNDYVPTASVLNPLGTILYGSAPVAGYENKKLKLEIYYTKPD